MTVRILASVDDHAEASVHHLAPADASAVVDRYPCRTAETVSDDIMHGHICAELGTVVDVRCLAERRVRAGNIVVVTSEDDRSCDLSLADRFVEGKGYLCTALAVGIKDTCLSTYHKVVLLGLFYPVYVVHHLALDLFRSLLDDVSEYLGGQSVTLGKVFRLL